MDYIKNYFKKKSIGFYLCLAGALMSLVTAIVYKVTFAVTESGYLVYYTDIFLWLLAPTVLVLGLGVSKYTVNYASWGLFVPVLLAFVRFVDKGYMYFSEGLFQTSNVLASLKDMHSGFMFVIITSLIILLASMVLIFLRQDKKIKTV